MLSIIMLKIFHQKTGSVCL